MKYDPLEELPGIMQDRARWARKQILEHPETAHIDENELIAWVFNDSDNTWYSIDGHYSGSSPEEKMEKVRLRREKEKAYKETIRREWFDKEEYGKVRIAVLERDDYTCQNCGIKKPSKFHVHHIQKKIDGGPDTLDNLITVCPSCHQTVELLSREGWK